MRRVFICLICCVALNPFRTVHAAEPAGSVPDIDYVPPHAIAAALAFPKRLLSAPEMQLLPLEVISAAGQKELGFDPLDVEHVLVFATFPTPAGQFDWAAVLRLSKLLDPRQLFPNIGPFEEAKAGDKVFHLSKRSEIPAWYATEQTVIVGTRPLMESILTGSGGASPLVTALKQADVTPDVQVMVSLEMLRPVINLGLRQLPPMPDPLADFLRIPQLVNTVTLKARLGTGVKYELILRAPNAEAAGELETLLQKAIDVAGQYVRQNLAIPLDADDPVAQASRRYIDRLLDAVAITLQPTRDGDRVSLAIAADSGLATTGMLVGLLLPAVNAAREQGRRVTAMSQMRQIVLAMQQHELARGNLPARAIVGADGKPLLSWRVALLPYMEQQELYEQFHLNEPWDSPHNQRLVAKIPSLYQNPNRPHDGKTVFLLPTGNGTLFEGNDGPLLGRIPDGLANTLVLIEADDDRAVVWTRPADWEYTPARPQSGLGHLRPNGFNVVFADGRAKFIPTSMSDNSLRAILSPAGGEVVREHLD
jgi:hypothetical protein